uniref:RRM domain-containing protein n=1 Tax=Trichuris muris TaxID=70415 RepID=A0A5S6QUT8_TRIMR
MTENRIEQFVFVSCGRGLCFVRMSNNKLEQDEKRINAEADCEPEIDLYGETETIDVAIEGEELLKEKGDSCDELNDEDEEDLFNIGDKNTCGELEVEQDEPSPKGGADSTNAKESNSALAGAKAVHANHEMRAQQQRRHSCYVGNLTWWTTDIDVEKALAKLDIHDVMDVRFYENRVNGQSKGFALVSFLSDSSVRKCLESFSTQTINGMTPIVMPYSKQSLMSLESASTKKTTTAGERPPPRPLMAEDKPPSPIFLGTVRLDSLISSAGLNSSRDMSAGRPNKISYGRSRTGHLTSLLNPALPIAMPSRALAGITNNAMTPPVMVPPPMPNRPPPGYPLSARPPPLPGIPPTAVPPPGSHVNPNFYPALAASTAHLAHYGEPMAGDPEYEDALNRNRTVSSSALTRAVADAANGDPGSAIETLVTAITILRSSKVAHDERSRILVASLQDTLRGIEKESYSNRRSKNSRDRSHNREYRKRRERSRSRSRDRHIDDYSPRRKRY